ncbi:MAG: lysophospholipid acyltransferase family protein [Kiritimatiellales bacterium]|nr:lysophospholipid acyltransferase family protein [Kiritimatiellales bacterium]
MSSSKQRIRAIRRPLETFFFKAVSVVIPVIPRRVILGIASASGALARLFARREWRLGMINLDTVFGDTKTDAEKRAILKQSFATFTRTMLDVFWFAGKPASRIPKYVDFTEEFKRFFHTDRLNVGITAHMGNWEVMGQSFAFHGGNLASIAATAKNAEVNDIFCQLRARTGQTIIPREGALKTLIARFRKNGKAAFLLDQNTREQDGGIWVDFLGMPTPISSAPALLAYRTGSNVFMAFCLPQAGGKYLLYSPCTISPPPFDSSHDTKEVTRELTQQIMDVISGEIRTHPEYWLWAYKHWRRIAPGDDPVNYPSYD